MKPGFFQLSSKAIVLALAAAWASWASVPSAHACDISTHFYSTFFPGDRERLVKIEENNLRIYVQASDSDEGYIRRFFRYFDNLSDLEVEFTNRNPNIILFQDPHIYEELIILYSQGLNRFFSDGNRFIKLLYENINKGRKRILFTDGRKNKPHSIFFFFSREPFDFDEDPAGFHLLMGSLFSSFGPGGQDVGMVFSNSTPGIPLEPCDRAVARLYLSDEVTHGMSKAEVRDVLNRLLDE